MAGVIGQKGSYGTISPIQGNPLGDAMQDIEDNAFKYRAEKRLEDEAKKKAEEDKNKEIEASVKAIKEETTPYETRNAMVIDFANKLRDGVYQKAMDYKNGKISKTQFDIFNANAQAQIATLNESSKRLTQKNADMTKLIQEGKLARGFEEDAISLGGAVDKNQISWQMRPDGVMEAIVYEKDPNTGEIKILDRGGLEKIGEIAYTPVMNVDFDAELEQFKKSNPMDAIETLNPMTKQKVTQITPRLKQNIANYVDAKLTDKNALSVAYYEATGEKERNISDDKKIEIAKQYLKDKYEKSYQKEIEVSEATQRANYGLAKKQAEKDQAKRSVFTNDTPLRNDVTGSSIPKDAMRPNFIGLEEGKVTFKNLGGEKGYGMGYITSAGLEKDGHIVVTGKALKTKGVTFRVPKEDGGFKFVAYDEAVNSKDPAVQAELEKYNVADNYSDITKIYSVDTPELNSLALKMGYKGVRELKSELTEINKEDIEKSKKNKSKSKNNDPLGLGL